MRIPAAVGFAMPKASAKAMNPKGLEAIGNRLRALRAAVAPSQAEFCRRLGVATNTWNQYEKGASRPDLDHATKIVQAFGVTLDWIYLGDISGLPHGLALRIAEQPPVKAGRGPTPTEGEHSERRGPDQD